MSETLRRSEELIASAGLSQHAVVNAAKIVAAQDDEALRRSLADSAIVNADGMSVVWASRLLSKTPLSCRVAGIDYMQELCQQAANKGWTVFLLGATQEVVSKVESVLHDKHPSLDVCGVRNGYWDPIEEESVIDKINAANPDILFLAFPSPAKEHFVERNRSRLRTKLVVGVGGSFDVLAGRTSRAPLWMQALGLEWFHRLLQEPRRMWRRYLIGNSKFTWLIFKQWIRGNDA